MERHVKQNTADRDRLEDAIHREEGNADGVKGDVDKFEGKGGHLDEEFDGITEHVNNRGRKVDCIKGELSEVTDDVTTLQIYCRSRNERCEQRTD